MLEIYSQKFGDVTVLCLQGEVVIGETAILRNSIQSLSNIRAIVLDLNRVTRIDARGLGLLLELRERVQAQGIEFKLVNVPRLIRQVIELACLNSVFELSSRAEVLSMAARGRSTPVAQIVACPQQA